MFGGRRERFERTPLALVFYHPRPDTSSCKVSEQIPSLSFRDRSRTLEMCGPTSPSRMDSCSVVNTTCQTPEPDTDFIMTNAVNLRSSHVVVKDPQLWNLYRVLRRHYQVYRGTGSPKTLLTYCQRLAPCVLLLDSHTAWQHAEEEPRAFEGTGTDDVSVVVVEEGTASPGTITEFLYLGCKGVLSSLTRPKDIRKAVAAVFKGEIWAPRQVLSSLLQKCLFQLGPNALTQREKDILELIATGLTNKEIGQKLFIARETVRWHIRSLYSKIGASDRLAAAVYAKEVLWLPKASSTYDSQQPDGLAKEPQTASEHSTPKKRSMFVA